MQQTKVKLSYFTDILCIWAYIAQARLDELHRQMADKLEIEYHFLPIFSCTQSRVGEGWKDKGCYQGFSDHIKLVAGQFSHVKINPKIWTINIPTTSANAHLFFKAVQLLQQAQIISQEPQKQFAGRNCFEEFVWQTRLAFFEHAQDISNFQVLFEIASQLQISVAEIEKHLQNGEAMAALFKDIELKELYKIEGSPSYLLNEGRQKLYGNVSYNIIAANVHEIIEKPENSASWC